ncbi:homoserine kinase [Oceanobacillus polygoni]|uniref:Homoserine kinase n=1 Tax=Oceanobacillus polygoni TaxID=1235259 RepID=A0A9X1CLN2_9BACI|nr:homoserine kinase [Oceanobacillus polygoni]MBP2079947.1 homoserine kinase [Oceanobacillus polygoni]
MRPFRISVPASSANIGPGFDSMGLAVNLYLTLEVTQSEKWEFNSPSLTSNDNVEEHFIYQIAKKIAERHHSTLPTCKITETSDIPLARGLGSSASAILAGIELANQACELHLSAEDKLQYGTEIEGHPDNIAPALFGGLIISTLTDNEINWLQAPALDVDLVIYIPDVELKTEAARQVLPDSYSRDHAATASGISNLVVAALLSSDYKLAGKMMEQDMFHESYRSELIPNYDLIRKEAKSHGAYGTVISGAGPTMISFAPKGGGQTVAEPLQALLPNYRVGVLEIDMQGLTVE